MIKDIVNKLVNNIDKLSENGVKEINVLLSGGAFNASYTAGCLYFLRELNERELIRINKISTCSASSLLGLLYLVDKMDIFVDKLYKYCEDSFKENKRVIFSEDSMSCLLGMIRSELPEDVLTIINNKLYITYYDVEECGRIVVSEYNSVDELLSVIRRSCFIPYLTMDKALDEGRYLDGGTPYIFNREECKEGVKNLYINVITLNNIVDAVVIKKDKTNIHRILSGVLDIHNFFFRGKNTSMCCYVEDWSIMRKINFKMIEWKIFCVCIFFSILMKLKVWIPEKYYKENNILNKLVGKFRCEVGKSIEYYCV
jgi:hypothetical protein